jgi:hypothetical protein
MAWLEITQAKAARVVSEREVAFNRGKDQGVQTGDHVTLSRRVEIRDPDTNEELGSVLVPKARFEVTILGAKYCVGRITDRVSVKGKSTLAAAWMQPVKTVTESELLESTDTVYVKAGDPAVIRRAVEEEQEAEEEQPES